jgi:hypothetical protein
MARSFLEILSREMARSRERPRERGTRGEGTELQTRAEDEAPGSSSSWETLDAKLTVMEGVEPSSKIAKYPHQRVEL